MNRREFITQAGAAALVAGCASKGTAGAARAAMPKMTWANYLRLGNMMWEKYATCDHLIFEEDAWKQITDHMAERKLNMVVWDLGEGMVFPSHPELRVKGSWEPERVREEIARLKRMGIVSVPKLNFSAGHDQWLGKWRRYLSTPAYYKVCREVIADVAAAFDESPLFHIGMDEETYYIQNVNKFQYVRIRRGGLWWHDFYFLVDEVERHGMRAWAWGDPWWHNTEEFAKQMQKRVLLSNWWYGAELDYTKIKKSRQNEVKAYAEFEKLGYDQVPCGSIYESDVNFGRTVEHCKGCVAPERLKGFFMAAWVGPSVKACLKKQLKAVDIVGNEIDKWGV